MFGWYRKERPDPPLGERTFSGGEERREGRGEEKEGYERSEGDVTKR